MEKLNVEQIKSYEGLKGEVIADVYNHNEVLVLKTESNKVVVFKAKKSIGIMDPRTTKISISTEDVAFHDYFLVRLGFITGADYNRGCEEQEELQRQKARDIIERNNKLLEQTERKELERLKQKYEKNG